LSLQVEVVVAAIIMGAVEVQEGLFRVKHPLLKEQHLM